MQFTLDGRLRRSKVHRKRDASYLTTGAGVMSEFIAAVFFYLYNQTITKMGAYHNRLVVTQNVSLALKIADSLEGHARADAHRMLVDRLSANVNWLLTQGEGQPTGGPPTTPPGSGA